MDKETEIIEKQREKLLNDVIGKLNIQYEEALNAEAKSMKMKLWAVEIISRMFVTGGLENRPTYGVYNIYKEVCESHNIEYMDKITFSRFAVKYFDLKIIDKKVRGKKYRVFIKVDSE